MISKIKWKNHFILGNLELDFTKDDGEIYDTIILAGENGTGKTTILDTISDLIILNIKLRMTFLEYFTLIEMTIKRGGIKESY